MKKRDFWKGVAFGGGMAFLIAVSGSLGYLLAVFDDGVVSNNLETVRKLGQLEYLIEKEYLEETDPEKLQDGLSAGLIAGLGDVYSRYYTAEEYREISASNDGTYVGIGVLVGENPDGGAKLIECYAGGPAEKAGLLAEDVITMIDGVDVTEMELAELVKLLQDEEKGKAVLTVLREGEDQALQIEVQITDVELASVSSDMLDGQVGYIQITEFTGVTPEQYRAAFSELKKQGMQKLVIDLRDNPGGTMVSVCDVLREILPEGLIVYTEDKNGERLEETCDGEHMLDMPMAVLVNGNSASAAEIFAGAVQDHEMGLIVGTTTYGKGVVQNLHHLSDGSAVKLTIARYYTPNGNSIHEIGITPDVEVELDAALLRETEISHSEDNQIRAAVDALQ